jgi:hypothetical protein
MRRYGRRLLGGDLEYNKGVTVKLINKEIKDMGFKMEFYGRDELDFPYYRFLPIGKVTHYLDNPVIKVYALGDYTVKEWKGILYKKLKETDPRFAIAAKNRQRKKRRRRGE